MRKYLLMALVGAYAIAQETTSPKAPPSNNRLDYQLDLTEQMDARIYRTEHYFGYTHTFDDTFKLAFDVDFYVGDQKNDADAWKTFIKERYARVRFIGSPFTEIIGFKTGWEVRYYLPISDADQQGGGFGYFSPRLNMTKEFGPHFNWTIIPKSGLYTPKKSYQKFSDEGKPNALVYVGVETLPQIVFSPGFTLTYDGEVITTVNGKSPTTEDKITYNFEYDHEIELLYSIKSFYAIGVGAIWQQDFVFGSNSQPKPFEGKNQFVGFRVVKSFDL